MNWKGLLTCAMSAVACGLVISLLQYGRVDFTSSPYLRPEPGSPLLAGDFFLRSVGGEKIDLRAPEGGAVVVVLYSAHSQEPLASLSTLDAIGKRFPRDRVVPIGMCVDPELDPRATSANGSSYSVVHDPYGTAARRLAARRVPEAFVLVGDGRLWFQGPVDELDSALHAALDGPKLTAAFISSSISGEPLPAFDEAPHRRPISAMSNRSCVEAAATVTSRADRLRSR